MKRGADMMDDQNSSFSITITLCIVINTIVLGLDTYPATPDYEYALEIINLVLSIIFTVEMFVKLFSFTRINLNRIVKMCLIYLMLRWYFFHT